MTLYPVVMAGGSGTRFWPLSRKARPKQFLALATRKAAGRRDGGPPRAWQPRAGPTWSAARCTPGRSAGCCRGSRRPTCWSSRWPATPPRPSGWPRSTSRRATPTACSRCCPRTTTSRTCPGSSAVLRRAAEVARSGALVTIGIRPTRPETGYGYIQLGEPIDGGACRVQAFVEKPDAPTAARVPGLGRLPLERRHLRLHRPGDARRHRPPPARAGRRCSTALAPTVGTRRHAAALKQHFPGAPVGLDRLRGDGEGPGHRGGARRLRLVRRGELRRAARGPAGRRGGQRGGGGGRDPGRLDRVRGGGVGAAAGRGGPAGHGGGGRRGRGAGGAAGPEPGRPGGGAGAPRAGVWQSSSEGRG